MLVPLVSQERTAQRRSMNAFQITVVLGIALALMSQILTPALATLALKETTAQVSIIIGSSSSNLVQEAGLTAVVWSGSIRPPTLVLHDTTQPTLHSLYMSQK